MNIRQNTGCFQQAPVILLLCLVYLFVFATSAFALNGNLIDQCSDCHGTNNVPGPADIRPNDLTYRNITTGAFVGNHRTHMATVITFSNVCTPCHGPAPITMDHRNGKIGMRQHINSSATLRGTYSKPVFFNQTSAPILGTCSNVNCHFQKASTPSWGTNAYTYTNPTTNDCAQCHGNGTTLSAPQDGSHPNTINKHGLYYGSDASSCAKCHANYTTFSHATSAGHRALILQGTDFPATAVYSKVTNLAYPAYLTTTPANRNGTCTTFYCHSQGTGGTSQGGDIRPISAPAVAPTWGGTVDCASCHTGGTATGPTYVSGSPKANSHNAHRVTNGYTCNICHYATTANGTTIATLANHVNKTYNLLADPSKSFTYTYASTGGTCKTSNCHGGAGINLAWATTANPLGTTQCTKCHGIASAVIGTNYSSASVAPGSASGHDLAGNINVSARGGVHQGHLTAATGISAPIHCGECHIVVTAVNTATHMLYTTARPVFTGNLATAQSHTPSVTRTAGIISCNTTYCHTGKLNTGAAMTPAWNNSTYLATVMTMTDCKKCHNMPPNPGVGIHSGIPAALTAFPVGTTCNCHNNLTTGGTTYANIFTDKTKHINGTIDATSGHAFPYPGATHDGVAGATTPATTCNCHDYTTVGGPYPVAAGIAPNCKACHKVGLLRTVATSSCYDCHGTDATVGMPNGGAFPNFSGSHTKHVVTQGFACSRCHFSGGTGSTNHGPSNRINSTNITFVHVSSNTKEFHFNSAGLGTCTNVACHGTATWGGRLGCVDCHASAITITKGPNAGNSNKRRAITTEFGANWSHARTGGPVTNQDCCVCHMEGNPTTGATVSPYHGNGVIELRDPDTGTTITNFAAATYTFGRFSTTFAAKATSAATNTTDYIVAQKFCLKCHDGTGAASPAAWVTGGTATKPFGTAGGTVLNIDSQFATTNASYHPVKGPQINSYCNTNTLNAPYGITKTPGTKSGGVVMVCWDCHNVQVGALYTTRTIDAHGSGVLTSILRKSDLYASGAFCLNCHKGGYPGPDHGVNSAEATGTSTTKMAGLWGTCEACHSSAATSPGRPTRAENVHGFNAFVGGGQWASSPVYAFMRNKTDSWTDWKPYSGAGVVTGAYTCVVKTTGWASACGHSMAAYTPGGRY